MPDALVPDKPLPAAVRRQLAAAENAARAAGVVGLPDADPPLGDPPLGDQLPGNQLPGDLPSAPPAGDPPPDVPPVEDQPRGGGEPTPPSGGEADAEQRFRTLQGKYNAEVESVRAENAQLRADLDQTRRLVADMLAQPKTPAAAAPQASAAVGGDDADLFGEDLIAGARRWARAEIQPELDRMQQRLDQLQGSSVEMQQRELERRNCAALDADPVTRDRWQALNVDPNFIGWLAQLEPLAGMTRQSMLNDACQRGDGPRIVRIFSAYIAEHTAPRPAPTPTPSPAQADGGARPTLEDMAAPGRGNSQGGGQGGAPVGRVWTRQEIAAFYRDRLNGVYDGPREPEGLALERDILAAPMEGRMRN